MSKSTASAPLWRLTRLLLRTIVRHAAGRVLANTTMVMNDGRRIRWLRTEITDFLRLIEPETENLRNYAELDKLPSFGNRLMVEMAIYTSAADRLLRRQGFDPDCARQVTADIGWHVYRRMLALNSLPARMFTRDAGKRLRWTVRTLLWFPIGNHGSPGYAVSTWTQGRDIHTHFTHCPPQSFARRVAEAEKDPATLEAFRASWCLYDWPGADVIAGDGKRGHYSRPHTLSAGDSLCDMCWIARPVKDG